jgi:outer membrane protein assembly factor BamB
MKTNNAAAFYFLVVIILSISCNKKQDNQTANELPSITTINAFAITATTGSSGGIIIDHGTSSISEKGICFNTTGIPTTSNSIVLSVSSSDSFTIELTNLIPNTNYYIRSYAKNSAGTAYGNQVILLTSNQSTNSNIDSAVTIYASGGRTKSLYAINAYTGAIKWKVTPGANVCVSPIYTSGKVIVGASDNKVYAYDTTGQISWTKTLDTTMDYSVINSGPIVNNGIIYISDYKSVYALNSTNGSMIWHFTERGGEQLIYKNNTIYFTTNYIPNQLNYLFAIDATTGIKKWQYQQGVIYTPAVSDDKIYFMSDNYAVYVLNANTGSYLWSHQDWNLYYGGRYVTLKYGKIYCYRGGVTVTDSSTGSGYLYTIPQPNGYSIVPPSVFPIVTDGVVICPFGAYDALNGSFKTSFSQNREPCGLTYANHIVYYQSGYRNVYDPNTGSHSYSDIYSYDITTKTLLWSNAIQNEDFFGVEPCVVTKSGIAYKGGVGYK